MDTCIHNMYLLYVDTKNVNDFITCSTYNDNVLKENYIGITIINYDVYYKKYCDLILSSFIQKITFRFSANSF